MSEALEKYKELRDYLSDGLDTCKVTPEQEDAILDQLDVLWDQLTDEECKLLDAEPRGGCHPDNSPYLPLPPHAAKILDAAQKRITTLEAEKSELHAEMIALHADCAGGRVRIAALESTEAALRKRLAEVLDFYDLARRRIAAIEAEVAHLRQRESFAMGNVALDKIESLEAALEAERTEHDAALAELTRSHTVVELEAQAEIERLEAALEAERGRADIATANVMYGQKIEAELRENVAKLERNRNSYYDLESAVCEIPDLGDTEDYCVAIKRVVRECINLRTSLTAALARAEKAERWVQKADREWYDKLEAVESERDAALARAEKAEAERDRLREGGGTWIHCATGHCDKQICPDGPEFICICRDPADGSCDLAEYWRQQVNPADSVKCDGIGCPRKEKCYRYVVESTSWQSWFSAPPLCEDDCEDFIDVNELPPRGVWRTP